MQLDHVQLAMPAGGEAQARAFFVGVIGMKEEAKPESLVGRGGCWFHKGGAILHLGVESCFKPQRKAHPAFTVASLEKLEAALTEAGHVVTRDATLPDRRRFYTTDPFGNRLEFLADGSGFSQK